jgi:hypothetical protein
VGEKSEKMAHRKRLMKNSPYTEHAVPLVLSVLDHSFEKCPSDFAAGFQYHAGSEIMAFVQGGIRIRDR